MNIEEKVAVVTGAASGIGRAVATELVRRGVAAVAMVDQCDSVKQVAATLNEFTANKVRAAPFVGDVTDDAFRRGVRRDHREVRRSFDLCAGGRDNPR